MSTRPPYILVSDFDGTMTRLDFYDLVCREFPELLEAGHWQQYEQGQITHFEALRRIFAGIRCEESRLRALVERMQFDPGIPAAIVKLRAAGWEVAVASAGCGWYIEQHFRKAGVSLELHSNPGVYSQTTGLELRLPTESLYFSPELGVNKTAVVKAALERSSRVAFAGDGRPDLAPALMVQPQWRFARNWLARKLDEIGESYQPFELWSEIADKLLQ